jgi:fatty acid desaturase
LSHQIEHHLFPDIPAARYPEMAPRVREICERYGQAYNTGSFGKQLGSVVGRIFRYALPRNDEMRRFRGFARERRARFAHREEQSAA